MQLLSRCVDTIELSKDAAVTATKTLTFSAAYDCTVQPLIESRLGASRPLSLSSAVQYASTPVRQYAAYRAGSVPI